MTATLVIPPDVDREAWATARRSLLGGSDIAAVLNVSPYDGPMTTWMSKVHGRRKPVNDAMTIGTHMEPWIINKYRQMHPTYDVVASPGTFAVAEDLDDNGRMWRAASPDGIATLPDGRRALVEAKTAVRYGDEAEDGWGDEDTDEIPYAYLCQVTWTCTALDLDLWVVPVLFLDGRHYVEYRGRLEPDLANTLVEHGRRWWNRHVVAGVEPAADHRESTRHILNDRYAKATPKKSFAPADPTTLIWQAEYCRFREQIKTLTAEQALRANLLRQAHVTSAAVELRHGDTTVSTLLTTKTGSTQLRVKEPTA